ncbi:hypothetical protein VCRA2119O48_140106 [Vibrio crassostreae]|nr:hypothetical protein VCRA2119O48_140106 [Vibrio crassostreae]CAK3774133.1 hypothetical protein VCRA212O16_140009 [Vibrio crassostreae]
MRLEVSFFFGTLVDKPPYEMACYQNWRLTLDDNEEYREARRAIGYLLESLLENISPPSPRPHGYVKIDNSKITLHWTSSDIVETMLDNIDQASKLEPYRGLNG